jgi:hypothetical protein
MKFTSRMLLLLLLIILAGLFSSNMLLKRQYDQVDKSDLYWTYNKVLEQPFKYLKIIGGNITNIAFEQSAKPSVRLLQEWVRYHGGEIKANVSNDTLYVNFDFKPANAYEKFWLQNQTPVRIFAPQLLSVDGSDTRFEMFRLKQKSIHVSMTGKSSFEVESMLTTMDTINVYQRDSSAVVFEMSPDYNKKPSDDDQPKVVTIRTKQGGTITVTEPVEPNKFNESMSINSVTADLKDHTILDIGHAQVQNLQLQVSDSSAVILSGGALKKLPKSL